MPATPVLRMQKTQNETANKVKEIRAVTLIDETFMFHGIGTLDSIMSCLSKFLQRVSNFKIIVSDLMM